MSYDALVDRLATDDDRVRLTAFPDGSVDTYCAAFDEEGDRIADRESFGDRIGGGEPPTIPIERESREPAGQATNAARQAHALGAETTLYGYLDDPVFDSLPFETVSMGEPARIDVFSFDDDLLLPRRPAPVQEWTLADLAAASQTGDAGEALSADAVCCGNWASIEGVTEALSTLSGGSLETDVFVLDPGPVGLRSRDDVSALLAALGEMEATTDAVYSVNRTELEYTADAIDGGPTTGGESLGDDDPPDAAAGDLERLTAVREAAGISAVVLHAADVAAAATRRGEVVVENLSVDEPRRRTGAGDRFGAGLAVGRARGWNWETALALGNCCAAYYVETAATGDRDALRSFLSARR